MTEPKLIMVVKNVTTKEIDVMMKALKEYRAKRKGMETRPR